ncbi:hypothetical protein M0811_09971 [Anaeramoeba ignava]|uniref:CWH43-like N-terminal domain-containing protein n=1 Tax=Anaeramoeba ignava TaxID=1746090 RepID=A0A9Q0LEK4_ANAIG|nr:hypothetical protein M0811_09971 [Anaeramoeba ignava]
MDNVKDLEEISDDLIEEHQLQPQNQHQLVLGLVSLKFSIPAVLIFVFVSIFTTYTLTMVQSHIEKGRIPYISETSVYQPECFIFGFGMAFTSGLMLLIDFSMYSSTKIKIKRENKETTKFISLVKISRFCGIFKINLMKLNNIAFFLGIIASMCLTLLSSVNLDQYNKTHYVFAYSFFTATGFHGFIMDFILYKLYRKRKKDLNSKENDKNQNVELDQVALVSDGIQIHEESDNFDFSGLESSFPSENISLSLKKEKIWIIVRLILDIFEITSGLIMSLFLGWIMRKSGYAVEEHENLFYNIGAIFQYILLGSQFFHTLGYKNEIRNVKVAFFQVD